MKVRFVGRVCETDEGRLKFGTALDLAEERVLDLLECRAPLVAEEAWAAAQLTADEAKQGWKSETTEFRVKAAQLMAASADLKAFLEKGK